MQWISKQYKKTRDVLPHEELCKLVIKSNAGDMKARNRIIEHNLGLCIKATFNKRGTSMGLSTIELDDIFQESIFGVIRAIELFDTKKGFAFSTYAQWWIDQSVQRYISNNSSMIRVPKWAGELQREYAKLRLDYEGREEDFYINLLAFENNRTPDSIRATLNYLPKTTSLNIADDEGNDVYEFGALASEDGLISIDAYTIKKMAGLLPKQDKKILMLRMENWTLEEIGEMCRLSRERVRQIEKRALIKLKSMVNQTRRIKNGNIKIR